VDFVHHQHLAEQSQQPQGLMPDPQGGQQSLIERPDADLREQGTLVALGQPLGQAHGRRTPLARHIVVELGQVPQEGVRLVPRSVGQDERGTCRIFEPGWHIPGDALEHLVGGGLGGKAEEQPVGQPPIDQARSQDQRRLGLARAGRILQHEQLRFGGDVNVRGNRLGRPESFGKAWQQHLRRTVRPGPDGNDARFFHGPASCRQGMPTPVLLQ